ncbi:hypothetical protein JWV37_09020 [Sulfurospirillum sp. T05]|uniref:KAP NTPase domain-containing protein n=1 Tax=Sulfurospirillum tamanense TaxID=2813362 RepID=A0ABS2WTK4_9BACT|nr:P-loop NTPase fold protein [Sulfurospirillum tamanensis]MBN2964918.1 hypothetical protein [Sulfurospirillum tamanensis]
MRLVLPALDINPSNPYEKDVLKGRQELGETLISLVKNFEDPLTISINAGWGEGKSTFLRMWEADLKNESAKVVMFDAFLHDYQEDIFTSFIGAISAELEPLTRLSKEKKSFVVAGKKVLKVATKIGLGVGLRVLSANAVGSECMQSAIEEAKINSGELVDHFINESLENYKTSDQAIKHFKEALKKLSEKLKSETGYPLVVIVDELDRCRPNYAVELLEKIKHFFDVDNVVFVLGVNKQQLKHSICSVYGNIDANEYLQKFISLEFGLTKTKKDFSGKGYDAYVAYLFNGHGFKGEHHDSLKELCASAGLTPREMNHLFMQLALCVVGRGENEEFMWLYSLLCVLKIKDFELYQKAQSENLTLSDLEKNSNILCYLQKNKRVYEFWKYVLSGEVAEGTDYSSLCNRIGIWSSDEVVPQFCEWIDKFVLPSK